MDKKYVMIRKRMIRTAASSLIGVVMLGGGMFAAQMYVEEVQQDQTNKEGALNGTRAQLNELTREMQSGQQQLTLHDTYIKNHGNSMTLNREQAMKWIISQRERYHLVNVTITIPPFNTVNKDTFPLKTGEMIRSEVKIAFGAITDNSVMQFIAALQKEMPGAVSFKNVSITRANELSRNVLMELSNHRITPVVNAEIVFDWIGVREEAKDKAANAKQN